MIRLVANDKRCEIEASGTNPEILTELSFLVHGVLKEMGNKTNKKTLDMLEILNGSIQQIEILEIRKNVKQVSEKNVEDALKYALEKLTELLKDKK